MIAPVQWRAQRSLRRCALRRPTLITTIINGLVTTIINGLVTAIVNGLVTAIIKANQLLRGGTSLFAAQHPPSTHLLGSARLFAAPSLPGLVKYFHSSSHHCSKHSLPLRSLPLGTARLTALLGALHRPFAAWPGKMVPRTIYPHRSVPFYPHRCKRSSLPGSLPLNTLLGSLPPGSARLRVCVCERERESAVINSNSSLLRSLPLGSARPSALLSTPHRPFAAWLHAPPYPPHSPHRRSAAPLGAA